MKQIILSLTLILTVGSAFAHSSKEKSNDKEGCHTHSDQKVAHCH